MNLNLLNWLKDSKYRIKTLKLLYTQPMLPSELARQLDVNRASMSRILNDLRGKELIEELPSESRTVIQKLTNNGRKTAKYFLGA